MDFRLTYHARQRMMRKGIAPGMIDAVLSDPIWSPYTSSNTRYDGLIEGRRLAVVIAEEWQPPIVVTAFWTDEEEG